MLTLIAAIDRNRAIGRGNAIPWHIPEDFAFFKKLTTGHPVIMGRKTWESLPRRPLPGRKNVVITRGRHEFSGGVAFTSLDGALEIAGASPTREAFCIGGAEIYHVMLPHAEKLVVTHVDLEIEGADAYFPEIDPQEWVETCRTQLGSKIRCEVAEMMRRP